MNTLARAFIIASTLVLTCLYCPAQQVASAVRSGAPAPRANGGNASPSLEERREHAARLRKRRAVLDKYLSTVSPGSEDYKATARAIRELDSELRNLSQAPGEGTTHAARAAFAPPYSGSLLQVAPEFSLAVPRKGRTNISPETTLTWTEDRRNGAFQDPPLYDLKRFRVVIARDEALTDRVHEETDVAPAFARVTPGGLAPAGIQSIATSFPVPADTLEPGAKYYWQVFAVYVPRGQTTELEQRADNGPYYFYTTLDPFHPLTKRNFTLQRTVDATDPTEGAQFSFLKSFGGDTVFSTDFAFFWDSPSIRFANSRGFLWFRPAVEAQLTSKESASEDAWRFSGSAVIDYNFIELETDEHNRVSTGTGVSAPRRLIDSLYFELGGALESDQGFDTKKLTSRLYVSPSSRKLAIGTATGQVESPFQFMWRPSFEFNAGHTFEGGDSAETGQTILRLVPQLRMTLYTRALSRFLRIADSYLYADNTFYYLPEDDLKKRHNYFTSGFEFLFIKNFGFGLTYKNGEKAPQFRRVNTFGGVLTVRFGPQ